ncbi:MAG: SET domain-containing protein [Patescibacteria group bacterium]
MKPNSKALREKKIKEAIILLNDIVIIKLAPSTIHGVGVFAMRDIKKDQQLYTDIVPHQFDVPFRKFNKLDKEIGDMLLAHFPLITAGSHFLYPVTKFSAYLNHSDTPNYDAKNDKALRDIKKGEEITEDYRLITNYKKIFKWLK